MNRSRFYLKTGLVVMVTLLLAPFYFFILLLFFRWRHRIGPEMVRFYSKLCLSIFRVRIEGNENRGSFRKMGRGMLIIANHASFLDIFVLSALFGSVFISKAEVKYYPVIGQIAWLMGVVFFNRDSRHERMRLIRTVPDMCSDRILVVFPQGTTSRITERLPFNRGIFKAVELNPDMTILPVTLHYRDDAEIAWYKPQSFRENAMRVSAQDVIHVRVIVHTPVTIDHYRGKNPEQICRMVERTVLEPLTGIYRD